MKALRIYAGPKARLHIEHNGLRPGDVGVVPGAAGGPKGLVLGPLDRFIFGDWSSDVCSSDLHWPKINRSSGPRTSPLGPPAAPGTMPTSTGLSPLCSDRKSVV